jgi:hypothetical protein
LFGTVCKTIGETRKMEPTKKAFLFSQSLKDKKTNRLNGVKNKIRRKNE